MNVNETQKRRIASILRKTPLYPYAKTLYRHTIYRRYLAQRRELIQFFSQFVKPGDLVFDIGANIGDFVDAFLRLGARVCAAEPNPFCIRELDSLYGKNSKFTLVDCALGSREGEMSMSLGGDGLHNVSTLSDTWRNKAKEQPALRHARWDEHIVVRVRTLDQLIQEHGVPAFCKIDVEGFESEVIMGLTQPLPTISLEYTPWHIEPAIACVEHLNGICRHEFNITMSKSRGGVGQLHFDAWLGKSAIIDLINRDIRDTDILGDLYARALA